MAAGFLYDLRTGAALAAVQSPTHEGFEAFATPGFGVMQSDEQLENVWVNKGVVMAREALALDQTDYTVQLGESLSIQLPADCHVFYETSLLVSEAGLLTITPDEVAPMRLRIEGRYMAPDIIIDVVSLADEKADLQARANERKQAVIDAGVTFSGHVWDADAASEEAIKNAAMSARLDLLPPDYYWTSKANENVPLDNPSIIALAQKIIAFRFAVHDHNQLLKAQIDAVSTIAQLEAIDLESNWPS